MKSVFETRRQNGGRRCELFATLLLTAAGSPGPSKSADDSGQNLDSYVVYMDVKIGEEQLPRRLTFSLFSKELPSLTYTVRSLCLGTNNIDINRNERLRSYKSSNLHRLIKGFIIQGGEDAVAPGLGSLHNLQGFRVRKHLARGLLSVANEGHKTSASKFCITLDRAAWLDGRHYVVGELVQGMDVLDDIEALPIDDKTMRPLQPLTIVDCGIIEDGITITAKDYDTSRTPSGDLTDQPSSTPQSAESRSREPLTAAHEPQISTADTESGAGQQRPLVIGPGLRILLHTLAAIASIANDVASVLLARR